MSLWRLRTRKDDNANDIVQTLRQHGCSVQTLSAPGVPDLLIGFLGQNYLLEVKRPAGKRGGMAGRELNPLQRSWHAAWRGSKPWIVRSPLEAVEWLKARAQEHRDPFFDHM